jgi:hypothetical protein
VRSILKNIMNSNAIITIPRNRMKSGMRNLRNVAEKQTEDAARKNGKTLPLQKEGDQER